MTGRGAAKRGGHCSSGLLRRYASRNDGERECAMTGKGVRNDGWGGLFGGVLRLRYASRNDGEPQGDGEVGDGYIFWRNFLLK